MPFSLNYTNQGQVLVVKDTGSYADGDDFLEKMEKEFTEFSSRGSKRILFDDRKLVMNLDLHDCITYVEGILDKGVQSSGLRYACIPPEASWDDYRGFETVLQNRSINYRLFKSEQDALDWLNS